MLTSFSYQKLAVIQFCDVKFRDYKYLKDALRIWSYSGPYFPAFALNTERYFASLGIQSELGKIRTRITPNKDTFHSMMIYGNNMNIS